MNDIIRIATRKSQLALWQAQYVKERLMEKYPDVTIQLLPMRTEGDQQLETSLAKKGGKGMFIKELEKKIVDGSADIAVHSMKDMTVRIPKGLGIAALLPRENPRDVFISNQFDNLASVPAGEYIGTSSLRRQAFIKRLRPDLPIKLCRGNVNTRLQKLDAGEYAGIILAYAGVHRLGMRDRVKEIFSEDDFLPAIGQGIIGIECHEKNTAVWQKITSLNDQSSTLCITAERAMNLALDGGCQLPIAGYAKVSDGLLWLRGIVAQTDGRVILSAEKKATFEQAQQLGFDVAEALIQQGAADIIARVKNG